MSDPHEKSGLSVTLKQDRKDGTWVVFHGSVSRIREDMAEALDIPNEGSLGDMIAVATAKFKGQGNVAAILGGKPVQGESSEPQQSSEDRTAEAIKAAIAAAKDMDALKDIWARYKEHVKQGSEVYDLFQAKTKEVQAK